MSLNLDALYSNNFWWGWWKRSQESLARHSQLIETSHGQIEYTLHGQGPVVLGLHGTPGGYDQSLFIFKEVIESGEFSLLTVSRPGYGRTPLSVGRSPAEQADAIIALLDCLHIEKVAVMAISGGGPTALQIALRHPKRIWALSLNAAVTKSYKYTASDPISDKILRSHFGMWLFNFLAKYFTKQVALVMVKEMSTYQEVELKQRISEILKDSSKVEFIKQLAQSSAPWSIRKEGLLNDEKEMAAIDNWPLEEISAPTLIIHGACDGDVNVDHAHYAAGKIPKAKKIISPQGFHLLELGNDYEDLIKNRLNFIREHHSVSS